MFMLSNVCFSVNSENANFSHVFGVLKCDLSLKLTKMQVLQKARRAANEEFLAFNVMLY